MKKGTVNENGTALTGIIEVIGFANNEGIPEFKERTRFRCVLARMFVAFVRGIPRFQGAPHAVQ